MMRSNPVGVYAAFCFFLFLPTVCNSVTSGGSPKNTLVLGEDGGFGGRPRKQPNLLPLHSSQISLFRPPKLKNKSIFPGLERKRKKENVTLVNQLVYLHCFPQNFWPYTAFSSTVFSSFKGGCVKNKHKRFSSLCYNDAKKNVF